MSKNEKRKRQGSLDSDSSQSIDGNDRVIKDSMYSRGGRKNKSPTNRPGTDESMDEYYEEGQGGDALHELGVTIGKAPGTQGQQFSKMRKRAHRIRLISDSSKIKDYNLEL